MAAAGQFRRRRRSRKSQAGCVFQISRGLSDPAGRNRASHDTLGHTAGDTVLAATAARLTAWAGPRASVVRLGGDEPLTELTPSFCGAPQPARRSPAARAMPR
ncbi:diguanylate cyclase domain-containing protein [Streptomyces virginiae]|uniref:diguanylate cyclase domain-containing protein n=1 Tax=Streptomyces virginiae TaxID=1961 RepID=UPI0037003A1C